MGNDTSSLSECQIDESPIFKFGTDFSLHHGQRLSDKSHLTVFVSKEQIGDKKNLLAMMAKNLKLYRHPFILRYVDFCEAVDSVYLFTEKGSPLSLVLKQQSYLQVSLGLQNIIQALSFLHDVGLSCHNNVAQTSIMVTPDGRWKLGGMEFVTKFDCMSQSFLESSHAFRYDKGISPEEKTSRSTTSKPTLNDHRKRDVFSLGVLIEEVLTLISDESMRSEEQNVESVCKSFIDFAKRKLQSEVPDIRPTLQEVLSHQFFQKDYLNIVAFLTDLPLKSTSERTSFFTDLTQKLFSLPEKVVSSQLAPLLLSRMVLLDETAAKYFLPNILTPAKGSRGFYSEAHFVNPILCERFFQEDLIPILLKIFQVRDLQIRSVLLRHFSAYCHMFHTVVLEEEVLPQLLLGIRDCHDHLVAESLRALAELVPILGASKVIGKKQRKVFADGTPGQPSTHTPSSNEITTSKLDLKSEKRRLEIQQKREERKLQMELKKKEKERSLSPARSFSSETERNLSQRHSPIGAETSDDDDKDENVITVNNIAQFKIDDDERLVENDEWDSWDAVGNDRDGDNGGAKSKLKDDVFSPMPDEVLVENGIVKKDSNVELKHSKSFSAKQVLDFDDISRLDIKTSAIAKSVETSQIDDFFADMVPVISETLKFDPTMEASKNESIKTSKFDVVLTTNDVEDGWDGNDGWD